MYWFDENDSVCCSQDIRIYDYCPPCQKNVLLCLVKIYMILMQISVFDFS